MKKNLMVLLFLLLLIIPLRANSLSIAQLKKLCDPLVPLDFEETKYYCTKYNQIVTVNQGVPADPFGNTNTPTEENYLKTLKDDNTCSNTGECFKGVGLMFQLIYYTGDGEPVAVGKKHHVYNPNLLKDQTIKHAVDLPTKPGDFRDQSMNYDIHQYVPPEVIQSTYAILNGALGTTTDTVYSNESNWIQQSDSQNVIHQDGEAFIDATGVEHAKQGANKYLATKDYIAKIKPFLGKEITISLENFFAYQADYSESKHAGAGELISIPPAQHSLYGKKSGYIKNTIQYQSNNYSKTTYPKTKILSPEWSEGQPLVALDFDGWEVDSSLTEEEVKSNYLKNKVTKYFARATVAETVKAVNEKFGTNISERDLEYYYIEVQAIYRVYTDKKTQTGNFIIRDIEELIQEEQEIIFEDSEIYSSASQKLCENRDGRGYSVKWAERGSARAEVKSSLGTCSITKCNSYTNNTARGTCCGKEGGTFTGAQDYVAPIPYTSTCTSKSCSSSSTSSCSPVEVPYWHMRGTQSGIKVIHRLLGTSYEGWSQLLYTKSSVDESCDSDSITTSLGDIKEQNKHCELDDFSNEYSEQEKANQCANTGYKHYIGPDPERALVGTGDNPFNLFGSDGNKCRSGVKHYYLFDLEAECDPESTTCIPKCQQVCADAGSKDSNTYLQCAENFCDHDVDYSLGGQPFVRKRDCLLNKKYCDYQYGREPTMGSSTSTERQAVSSCANTKLFKTGSGTSYTLEKTPINSLSTCGTSGASDLSELTGKDSVCIGDVVTDYNGTDAGDISFDKRTYINIACQEEESITSIGGMNDPVKAGLPISYSIKTKGKVTCVAFFNYEQWKVDYAIVPSQDIIRRKRLDYIYQKYNNLMTNGYTVDSSLTSFDAYDLDGKTMQHWTITDADGLGQIKWDNYIININNSSARAESKETLKNDTTKKQEENPLTDFTKDIATLSVVPSEMDLTSGVYKAYNTGNSANGGGISNDKKLIKIANNSITTPGTGSNGNSILMGYVQTSTDTKSYVYAKYCVDREGKVTEADATGVCSDGKTGNNVFYTDLSDVQNLNANADIHNIKGTVDVTTSLPTSDLKIYKDEDICPIKIVDDIIIGDKAYCKFKIISGDSIGDKTFLNSSGVEVMIEFYDSKGIVIKPDSFTVSITSPYRNETSTNKYNPLKLKNSALASGLEDIKLNGTFTASGYITHDCTEQLTIIQKGNMCDIEKKENKDKEYNVNTNVSNPAVVMGGLLNQRITQDYNGNHYPTNLGRLGRPTHEGELYKYLLDLKKSKFDDQSVVVGYVNNGSTGEFCYRPEGTIKQCVKNETTGNGLYLPGQYEEITKYCSTNWAKDTYGYDSYADCVDTCARCPTHENEVVGWEDNAQDTQDNLKKVNDFCDAYATYGYSSKDACVSLVYERCINPGEYKYRPVNTSNPFPSAVDNATIAPGYNVGDRIIGSNWKGKEHYITEGNPSTPRYQIALTADRIKLIRNEISKDTKAGIYTQLHPVNDSVESKSYMSKYIRNNYYDMFCFIQGERTNSTTGGCEINQ